jgi:histidyl-tRNA synthetase
MESTSQTLLYKLKTSLNTMSEKKVVLSLAEILKSGSENRSNSPPAGLIVSLRLWRKVSKALEDADKRKVDFAVLVGEEEPVGAVVLKI